MEDYVGSASAATLGYITSGIRGARSAYNLYQKFSNMKRKSSVPHTPRKRHNARKVNTTKPTPLQVRLRKADKHRPRSSKKKQALVRYNQAGHSTLNAAYVKVFRSKGKLRVKKHRGSGIWRHFQTHNNIVTGAAGNQTSFDMLFVNTVPQNITSTGSGYGIFQAFNAYRNLNPNLTNTGSSLLGATVTPAEDKYLLLDHNIDIEITNLSAVAIEFDFFICQCKQNTVISAYTAWSTGYGNMSFGTPQVVPPVAGSTTGTSGYNALNIVGARPKESKLFRDFWKIKTVRHFGLAGNGTQKFNINIVQNQLVKNEDMIQLNANGTVYHKGSFDILCVARGQVVEDTTVGTLATFGSIKFGWIGTVKTALTGVPNLANRLNSNNAAVNYPTAASTANQRILNEVDAPGTVAANTA
nr:MAG: capsid protein [Cressdnaviricota sp.]